MSKQTQKELDALGAMVDKVYDMRAKRLAAERGIEDMKAEEKALHVLIAEALRKHNLQRASGQHGTAGWKRTVVATVDDEEAFLKWAKLKGNRDVLKVGVVGEAYRARIDVGEKVPGVTSFVREDLNITKAGS